MTTQLQLVVVVVVVVVGATRVTVHEKLTHSTCMHNFSVRDSAIVYDPQSGSAEDRRLNLRPPAMVTAVYMVLFSPSECQHISLNQAITI